MLAPEVWSFDPPNNTLKILEGSLGSCEEIEKTVKGNPFNHLVSVILPDTPQVPQDILDALSVDNEYYKLRDISAHEFIRREFLKAFVERGHLTVLSIESFIDLDNSLSLVDGHLVLSLNRESYQELGLEGKPTFSKSKECQRYIVSVDLTASYFSPGKKGYERVYDCLKNYLQSFNVILSWEPPDDKICPSSIASYLCGRGLKVEVCKPQFKQRRDFNVAVPQLHPCEKGCDIEEMIEWLGCFSLDVNSEPGPNKEFLSSYIGVEETVQYGQVACLCWEGFFTSSQVNRLLKAVREYFSERDDIPWASLYVQGFSDVPVCWNFKPHAYFSDGDNSYTLVVKPKHAFILASLYSNSKMIK